MMRLFILFLIVLSSTLSAASTEHSLKKRLQSAESGDFIVAQVGKMITLLALRSPNAKTMILEEISIPAHNLKERPSSWHQWIKEQAPGHTSWSMVEIDLENAQILECYSFSRASWIQTSENESLLVTLLSTPLQEIAAKDRRKIGPSPLQGESDRRQLWEPPLTYQGKKMDGAHFDAFQTTWPKDQSELSEKVVSLYFDQKLFFPLPFWIQIEGTHISTSFQVIDSGKNLPSYFRSIPRRVPEFVGQAKKNKDGLTLSLKCPKYFQKFELFAIDVTSKEKKILPVHHTFKVSNHELVTIEVEDEHLQTILEPTHRYTWLVVPLEHTGAYTETTKPFTWH